MKKLCGYCNAFHEVIRYKELKTYDIKGTEVTAVITILKCKNCDNEIYDEQIEIENDIILFDEYKRKNNLLTSTEIRTLRNKYGISQATLSKILGFGQKTITRYENGAIQDIAHDNLLRLIHNQNNFHKLCVRAENILTNSENQRLNSYFAQEIVKFKSEYDYELSKITYDTLTKGGEVLWKGLAN